MLGLRDRLKNCLKVSASSSFVAHDFLNNFDRGGSLLRCSCQVCVRRRWLKRVRIGDVHSSLLGHCGTMAGEGPDVLVSDGAAPCGGGCVCGGGVCMYLFCVVLLTR